VLSNQQLYLVNHFALVARRHGLHLPDLKELLRDETELRQWIDIGLSELSHPAVIDAAAKLSAALSWQGQPAAAAAGSRPVPRPAATATPAGPRGPSAPSRAGLSPQERDLALAALQDVAGPIAGFIAEQVDAMGPMSLGRYLDQAATLAQLNGARRRALRVACGLAGD
jgi:hypothetical protein